MDCLRSFAGVHRCWTLVQTSQIWQLRMPDSYQWMRDTSNPGKIVLRNGYGQTSVVEVYCNGVEVYIRDGWDGFMEDNDINPFDIIVFSYDSPKLLNVAILKVGGDEDPRNRGPVILANQGVSLGHVSPPTASVHIQHTGIEGLRSLAGAYRCWTLVQTTKIWQLRMPDSYARRGYTSSPSKIVLRTGDGKKSEVEIYCNGIEVYISGGWSGFMEDNHIKPFDIIVFSYDSPKLVNVAILKVGGDEYPVNRGPVAAPYIFMQKNPIISSERIFDSSKGTGTAPSGSGGNVSNKRPRSHSPSPYGTMLDVTSPWSDSSPELGCPSSPDEYELSQPIGAEPCCMPVKCTTPNMPKNCQIVLAEEAVKGRFNLELPISFARACLNSGDNEVNLRMDTTVWPLSCRLGIVRAKVIGGWRAYAICNKLQAGSTIEIRQHPDTPLLWDIEIL